jgi:hypothetical protein
LLTVQGTINQQKQMKKNVATMEQTVQFLANPDFLARKKLYTQKMGL